MFSAIGFLAVQEGLQNIPVFFTAVKKMLQNGGYITVGSF